jgi:hypothetical protein
MKTSEFLDALRSRPELPLEFSTAAGSVPAGYHLTEVKRVALDTVDCGSKAHSWMENQFELWSAGPAEPDNKLMRAGKFLSIVEKVRPTLSLDERAEARVFGSVAGGPDQLHDVASIETGKSSITVHLEPVTAQCKAAQSETGSACCTMATGSELAERCGCEARKPSPPSDSDVLGIQRLRNMWFTPFESQGFRFMF